MQNISYNSNLLLIFLRNTLYLIIRWENLYILMLSVLRLCLRTAAIKQPIKLRVFWDHHQGLMEAVHTSETSVNICLTARQYISENSKLNTRRENLKSHKRLIVYLQLSGVKTIPDFIQIRPTFLSLII
jgi:hypothetical protein